MRTLSIRWLSAAVLVLGVAASTAVIAHGGQSRARVGVYIGGPMWYAPWYNAYPPAYYNYPYYYPYPYAVGRPSGPTEYIEQGQAPAAQGSDPYWYYCPEAKAYYPYVDKCAAGFVVSSVAHAPIASTAAMDKIRNVRFIAGLRVESRFTPHPPGGVGDTRCQPPAHCFT